MQLVKENLTNITVTKPMYFLKIPMLHLAYHIVAILRVRSTSGHLGNEFHLIYRSHQRCDEIVTYSKMYNMSKYLPTRSS